MSTLTINLEIGHNASLREKITSEGYTHDWDVFVRGPNNTEIRHFVEKVVFHLHETFENPKRVLKEPPYIVKTSGYAGFNLPIYIYLKNNQEPRKIQYTYDLQLQPSGPPLHVVQKEKYTFYSVSEDFRNKLLKGGAVVSSSLNAGSSSSVSTPKPEEKSQMTSKPKLSGSDQLRKYKLKPEEPKTDQFTDLFGEPITKRSQVTEVSKNKEFTKPVVKNSDKDKGDKISGKDKSKTKSPHKDKERDKERDKEKSRDKEKEKQTDSTSNDKKSKDDKKEKKDRESSKKDKKDRRDRDKEKEKEKDKSPTPRIRSPSPKRSPKRPRSPTPIKVDKKETSKEKDKESKDRDKEREKKIKRHKEKESKHRDKEKDKDRDREKSADHSKDYKNRENKSIKDKEKENSSSNSTLNNSSKERDRDASPMVNTQSQKLEKKEKVRERDIKDVEKAEENKAKEKEKERPEDKPKHKHKKKDKDRKEKKEKDREEKSYKKEKEDKKQEKEKTIAVSTLKEPSSKERDKTNNLFGNSPKSEPPPSPLEDVEMTTASHLIDDDSSNASKVSSRELSPIHEPPPPLRSPSPPPIEEPIKKPSTPEEAKKSRDSTTNKKKERKERKKDKNKGEKDHKRKRKLESDPQTEIEETPAKIEKKEEDTNNNSDDEHRVSSTEDAKPIPFTDGTDDYMNILKGLQAKIMGLKDHSNLQKVVQLIAATGRYEVSAHTFDFDLCLLDRSTVMQLQDFFSSIN
ncbi:protein AF-9-like [Euwallacea fornicatus]|uniref:protein AF-9-like n=1 Tax=Euwallacea fornicatus TaxID=995702 RepID=UPI00338DCBCA